MSLFSRLMNGKDGGRDNTVSVDAITRVFLTHLDADHLRAFDTALSADLGNLILLDSFEENEGKPDAVAAGTFIQVKHHGRRSLAPGSGFAHPNFLRPRLVQIPQLGGCEMLIALTAPKGRIDEYLGDHHEELATLVKTFGATKGVWICRYRLITTMFRMVPSIAVRAIRLFYSTG